MDSYSDVKMGEYEPTWRSGMAKSITFIVTEDCQLRCGYCYIIGKNKFNRMSFTIARTAVDYILHNRALFWEDSVIWDFIGGEPLLEIELIDRICDYIKRRMYELDHPWFNSYRFSFSTNGLLYGTEKVQRFIRKNAHHLSISISIDGTRKKHDAQRVFPDGSGSYDAVVKNVPLWLKQFPNASTKATVAHDDLPLLKESVIHLWQLGLKNVTINLVNENIWEPGDDIIYETQLRELADYIVENDLYDTHNCSFFSKSIGKPLDCKTDNGNWCGSGKMLAIDGDGVFYPCVRFAPYSMRYKPARSIGNCFDGLDMNRVRPFLVLNRSMQSPEECIACDVASGCAWCQGNNYDLAATDTIYQRAVYTCAMHKARVRANRYFGEKLADRLGRERPVEAR
ncbi:radical SAM peptide maturase, CXXX-repeat target family [Syntrophus aciditrophicus]|uniref:Radical SAM superfamily protein n=1 Tax=Syntrophus aciditrophicus (strain SB) TaxID=56780 RepID=Q2LXE2_SYNAS|nr:radical SAM peptide maturase, CXXX-repeat target family [Syntrophus aciditrophicus]ABC78748.1 radical SAM superfamily protein [Syntrophus aciditrophicus SB]